jgi:hypothetical protein
MNAVTEDDLRAIIKTLIREAKGGDMMAIREVLDRCIGKPLPVDRDAALQDEKKIIFTPLPVPAATLQKPKEK